MILNKKIQNQTSKQAKKKHTTKQEFKKCKNEQRKMKLLMRVSVQKWTTSTQC